MISGLGSPGFIDESDGNEYRFHKWGLDYTPRIPLDELADSKRGAGRVFYLTDSMLDQKVNSTELIKACDKENHYGESFYLYHIIE